MPTWKITAPENRGRVTKGTSFTVVSRTTSFEPNAEDIEEVLYINGYKESGGGTARSYRSAGNWICEKISDDTEPAWSKQHEKYESAVDDDKHKKKDEEEAAKARKKQKEDGGSSSGCCSICKCIWKVLTCFC